MVGRMAAYFDLIEKKDELERYPYDDKGYDTRSLETTLKKEPKVSEHIIPDGGSVSPRSLPSSPSTEEESDSTRMSPVLKVNHYASLPFLTPRYAVVNSRDRHASVYLAKVLYHRSYVVKRNLWNPENSHSY